MTDLSIVIVSYNTHDITEKCIQKLLHVLSSQKNTTEIIVVDNASSDGSVEMIKKLPVKHIFLPENVGFSKGNNKALDIVKGRYILYLNSDVMVEDVEFDKLISYMDSREDVGVMTVRVNLPQGGIDPASHRGFPTVWRSFTYFSGLERFLGKFSPLKKIIGGYHLLDKNLNKEHEIDSPTGAFFLVRKSLVDILHGFDESFFMYGEDLDLAFRVKKLGYKIVWYPKYSVTHLKYQSGLKTSKNRTRSKTRRHFYEAMGIFYKKHYEKDYPAFINQIVYGFIYLRNKLS